MDLEYDLSTYDISQIDLDDSDGMDVYLNEREEPNVRVAEQKKASRRVKVASLKQLEPFVRTSSETLINKSTRDMWALGKTEEGDYYIERLFDEGVQT